MSTMPLQNVHPLDFSPAAETGALGARRYSTASLPVIDIGALSGRRLADKKKVADELAQAAHEVGFFYIVNHPIPRHQITDTLHEAERFFGLPEQEKLRSYIAKSRNHRGYVPQFERGEYEDEQGERHYEAFDLALDLPPDDPDYHSADKLLGPNVWPALAGFRESVYRYYESVSDLAQLLCRAFEIHLRLAPGYFRQFMDKPTSQLRLLHYIENKARLDARDMNMGAHTDYECFTILHQTKPGLQVMNSANEWVEATPIDGAFVVNIGDMMEAWTNGLFRATLHRVVNNGRERYSMPYFQAANFDAEIRPVDTVVSQSQPSRYPTIKAGEHLLSQLVRDFAYLKRRHQNGELALPGPLPKGNPFEQRPNCAGAEKLAA